MTARGRPLWGKPSFNLHVRVKSLFFFFFFIQGKLESIYIYTRARALSYQRDRIVLLASLICVCLFQQDSKEGREHFREESESQAAPPLHQCPRSDRLQML